MAGAVRVPHHALRPLLGPYVGYDDAPHPDAVHFGLPSVNGTVILAFEDPLDVSLAGRPGAGVRRWTLASGLHTGPALIRTHGLQRGIQLSLTPLGSRVLLGLPLGPLASGLVGHEDLPRGVPDDLHARLAALSSWEERFDALEAHLLRLAGDGCDAVAPELREAWRLTVRGLGRLRVDHIAETVGWSRRHLAGRFTAEYGVSPKQAARLARFGHARRLAAAGLPLAVVAQRAGFADQPHLTREWTSFAGRSPLATLAEAFPILQDVTGHGATGLRP